MRRKPRRWIGVDGEGIGRKPHRYTLLACSDGDYIEDRCGLDTIDCLEFLLDLGSRDGRVCGYGLSYDWTKILQDLTKTPAGQRSIVKLFRPEMRVSGSKFAYVKWKKYELHWLAGAMWIRSGKRRVTVWDLVKYYQEPFVDALKKWNVRPDVVKSIARMKKKRATFTYKQIESIRSYCLNECEALAELAAELEKAHIEADLKPRSWFGPGSSATVLLNRYNIREQRGPNHPILYVPIASAFFGGWSEISRNGYVEGPIHGYDISSAYPAHATRLPCLVHGRWKKVKTEKAIKTRSVVHALVRGHIRDVGEVPWAPLPVRLANGTIVRPRSGASGWWWRDEWLAARTGWKGLEFDHAWALYRECDCKPFAFLEQIFYQRLEVGKETGRGKILKLTPNSVYGKLAQTVGKAQFGSRTWAGMITSGTRAQVLDLMMRHKRLDSVLMIATDGLFSTEKIKVDKKITLGGWEHSPHKSITILRPGMYWIHNEKVRARGLGRDNLEDPESKRLLLKGLKQGAAKVRLAPRQRFGGARVMVLPKAFDDLSVVRCFPFYGEWFAIPSDVSLSPEPKRTLEWKPPELASVESQPYGTPETRLIGEFEEVQEHNRELTDW